MSLEGNSAPILTLGHYLSGKDLLLKDPNSPHVKYTDRLLVVPPWQREYVWSPTQDGEVGQLLLDLRDFVNGSEIDYLMGSVLLSHGAKSNERLIIDGQQRTLTYSILIMEVLKHVQNQRDSVHHLGSPDENTSEDRVLVEMRSAISGDDGMYVPRVSMPQSRANDMLQSIFAWSKVADGEASKVFTEEKEHWTQTQRNLIDVATWIYEKQLKTEEWLPNKSLLRAMKKIMNGVKFLQITLEGQQEAIAVFDRINSRGALLDSGDLIKNRIFQTVEDDESFDRISSSWLQMNESLAKCSLKRMREPKFLLRALALADQDLKGDASDISEEPSTKFSAPKITYEKLTNYWGERLDPKLTKGASEQEKKLNPFDFSEELVNASEWLYSYSVERTPEQKSLKELYFSRYLNSVQHYPMLLAGRNIKDFAVLTYLTKQVHARTAFYLLSEERTQDFESLVPIWTGLISKAGANASKEDLKNIFEEYVQVNEDSMNLLMEQMRNWTYTSTDKKKIRSVLSQLTRLVDLAGGKEDKESPISYFSTKKDANQESWDIDHILPKKSAPRDAELHKIGNLVLLKAKHNSLKKAVTPDEKADVYRGSHLLLTQNLTSITVNIEREKVSKLFAKAGVLDTSWDLKTWDENSMNKRADMYCSLLRYHLTELD